MRRFSVNVILIAIFGSLMVAIIVPFAAETEFEKAKKLEVTYRWRRAGEKYQQAVHLNPLNSEYFAQAGDFMLRQSEYREGEERISWLKRAEKLYERACQLNPRYAENWYLLGETQITQMREKLIEKKLIVQYIILEKRLRKTRIISVITILSDMSCLGFGIS